MYHVVLHSQCLTGPVATILRLCTLFWHTFCTRFGQAGGTDSACLPEQVMRANGLTSVTLVAHSLAGVWAQASRPWSPNYV